MNQLYHVEVETHEVVVRFNKDIFDNDDITRFLDYLELEAIRKRSQMTQEQAEMLADEIDAAGWERLKSTFVPT
jgi:hypothetical protein